MKMKPAIPLVILFVLFLSMGTCSASSIKEQIESDEYNENVDLVAVTFIPDEKSQGTMKISEENEKGQFKVVPEFRYKKTSKKEFAFRPGLKRPETGKKRYLFECTLTSKLDENNKKTYDFYVISTPNGVTTIRRG